MHITLYHDPQSLAATCGVTVQAFDGGEIETLPTGLEFFPSRHNVHIEDKRHVRISVNARDVPDALTLLLEYRRVSCGDETEWHSANASVTFNGSGCLSGEWEELPPDCYGDVQFRAVKCDAGGRACVLVSADIDLR